MFLIRAEGKTRRKDSAKWRSLKGRSGVIRLISLFMILSMILTLMPATVFAKEGSAYTGCLPTCRLYALNNTQNIKVVTFDWGIAGVLNKSVNVDEGSTVMVPETPEDYTAEGYYTNAAYTTEYLFDTPVTSDLTIYVRLVQTVYYTVCFNTGNGSEILPQRISAGATVAIPPVPTCNGYVFLGWYRDEALTVPCDFAVPVNGDITIYAAWKQAVQSTVHIIEIGPASVDLSEAFIDGWIVLVTNSTGYATKAVVERGSIAFAAPAAGDYAITETDKTVENTTLTGGNLAADAVVASAYKGAGTMDDPLVVLADLTAAYSTAGFGVTWKALSRWAGYAISDENETEALEPSIQKNVLFEARNRQTGELISSLQIDGTSGERAPIVEALEAPYDLHYSVNPSQEILQEWLDNNALYNADHTGRQTDLSASLALAQAGEKKTTLMFQMAREFFGPMTLKLDAAKLGYAAGDSLKITYIGGTGGGPYYSTGIPMAEKLKKEYSYSAYYTGKTYAVEDDGFVAMDFCNGGLFVIGKAETVSPVIEITARAAGEQAEAQIGEGILSLLQTGLPVVFNITAEQNISALLIGVSENAKNLLMAGSRETTFHTPFGSMTLDSEAFRAAAGMMDGEMKWRIEKVATSAVSEIQSYIDRGRPVYHYSFVDEEGHALTFETEGNIKLKIPYALQDTETTAGLSLVRINDQGVSAQVADSAYADNAFEFTVSGFSYYAVAYAAPQTGGNDDGTEEDEVVPLDQIYSTKTPEEQAYAGIGSSLNPYVYLMDGRIVSTPAQSVDVKASWKAFNTISGYGDTGLSKEKSARVDLYECREGNSIGGDLIWSWEFDGNKLGILKNDDKRPILLNVRTLGIDEKSAKISFDYRFHIPRTSDDAVLTTVYIGNVLDVENGETVTLKYMSGCGDRSDLYHGLSSSYERDYVNGGLALMLDTVELTVANGGYITFPFYHGGDFKVAIKEDEEPEDDDTGGGNGGNAGEPDEDTGENDGGSSGETEPVAVATPADTDAADLIQFEDISKDDWYYEPIRYVVGKGLFKGVSENHFAPDEHMTRAMFVAVLGRMAGGEIDGASVFSDVAKDAWYAKSVAWAADKGIVKGTGGGLFDPDTPITREQMVQMLFHYTKLNQEVSPPTDGAAYDVLADESVVSEWAKASMHWACGLGLLGGDENGLLNPAQSITRAEVATIVGRYMQLAP